ncbi:MAG: GntR family transcriptional regulator [Pirellulales bacterium]
MGCFISISADSNSSPKPGRTSRELFKTKAYEELRSRLFNCQYEPGIVLSERQLAAELGMSKTPVKAALERLELEGFITVSPQSGIRIRELTDTEIAELYDVRIALECFVLRSVTGRLTIDQLDQWDRNLQTLAEIALDPSNRKQVVELDTEFHSLPSQFMGNQQIIKLMEQYSQKIRMVTHSVFTRLPNRAPQSLAEHREIYNAVRNGDGQSAAELMESHIRLGHNLLRNAIAK